MLYKVCRIHSFLLRNRLSCVLVSFAVHDASNITNYSAGRECFSAMLPNDKEFHQKKAKCASVSYVALKPERDALVIGVKLPAESRVAMKTSVYAHFEAMKTTALFYATKVQLSDLMKRCCDDEHARITQTGDREIEVKVNLPKRDIKKGSLPVSLVLSPATADSPANNDTLRMSSRGLLLETETLPAATVTLIDVPLGQCATTTCHKTLELSRFSGGRIWLEQQIQKPSQRGQCARCRCGEVSTVCLPCGHLCLCTGCANVLLARRREHQKSVTGLYNRVALQLSNINSPKALHESLTSFPSAEVLEKILCPVCRADAELVEIVRSPDQYRALFHNQTLTINSHIENETFQAVIDNMCLSTPVQI